MPIIVPRGLSCAAALRAEGVKVLHRRPADTAVLRVGLLNLMPEMAVAERQFAHLLGITGHMVELVPALPPSRRVRRETSKGYQRWDKAALPDRLDGLIVTGAPLEHVAFEDVTYWNELSQICDWASGKVGSTLYVCWAAFAAMHRFHGVGTRMLPQKISGVYRQHFAAASDPLIAGLEQGFPCAVSRHAEVVPQDIPWQRGLACLAQSPESGLGLIADSARNAYYMFNHLEYDALTLKREYLRDRGRRTDVAIPKNYLPNDAVDEMPPWVWRPAAEMFFVNWLSILAARASAIGRDAAPDSRAA